MVDRWEIPDNLKEYVIVQDVIKYCKEHEFSGDICDSKPELAYIKEKEGTTMK